MKAFGILGAWRRRLRHRAVIAKAELDAVQVGQDCMSEETIRALFRGPIGQKHLLHQYENPIAHALDPRLLEQLIERGRPDVFV